MAIARPIEAITVDDAAIAEALEDAFLPALLPALAQATGDFTLLRDDLRPAGALPGVPQGGMTKWQQAAAKALALNTIVALRDGAPRAAGQISEDDLRSITAWMTGAAASEDYIPLLYEELAPSGEDRRAPQWRYDGTRPFNVVVIGAGMSGLLAAIRCKQAGLPFVVIEKNADVGGTWFENTYPGARVDVTNAVYSYSFAQKLDWPKHFSPQGVLLEYFRDVADEFGMREHCRFETEVLSATWDDDRAIWSVHVRTAAGVEETIEANAVISAVGQLNRPNMPKIDGMSSFEGPSFHSAQWDHDIDLKGKRVAVIGTGASAAQFIPEIAKDVAHLDIYQRTPGWFVPVPHYHEDVPAGLSWLFLHIPHYMHWYRFWFFWTTGDGLLPAARVDEGWGYPDRSVSEMNDGIRMLLTGYIQSQFMDRPDLAAQVVPSYPPASKRMILDNGVWAETLRRDNVRLISEHIARVTPRGIETADGEEHPADVIIYGTGFQASHFLTPMTVTGRHGIDINAQWDGDARAYMGITVPNFPNFYMLYGPNTNIVVNGSITYFSECEVRYVMGCLRLLVEDGIRAMDVRRDVHDAYNERIDAGNRAMAWGASSVNTWYKNEKGRITQNWPFDLTTFWKQTLAPDPADYELIA